MASPLVSETESPYRRFRVSPNDEFIDEEEESDRVFMTMTDRDGSILYERESLPLLNEIVRQNDLKALEQYFTSAPWAVPKAPNGEGELSERTDYFLLAVESGSLDILQRLLTNATRDTVSAQPMRFKTRGFQLLNEAARYGHIEIVQFLLDHQPLYASIQDRDTKGYTAILSATDVYSDRYCYKAKWDEVCLENNEAIINLLLDRGACASDTILPINDIEKTPDTVLTLVVKWAGPELIKRLIDCGADVHAAVTKWTEDVGLRNSFASVSGVNALAISCYHANFKAAETLIDCRGVGVDAASMACSRDSLGGLPLHWVTRNELPDEFERIPKSMLQERVRNITSLIELLLDLDPTAVNTQDRDGFTPLHYATETFGRNSKLYTPIFELLCKRGGDASIRNNKGQTPLHTLFGRWMTKVPVDPAAISVLLAHGAKVTDTVAGNTPLHIAAGNLHFADAVSFLLDHGADPAVKNLSQATALHRAASGGSWVSGVGSIAEESTRLQEDMLARLVKAGGVELMDLPDAHGETPRQICQRKREQWRIAELPREPPEQLRFPDGRLYRGFGRGRPGRGGARPGRGRS
ncbi:Ankyrin-3 [Fusarium oxysporum f. sp. conglutinans]|nr:Ankyrin-3 [Fusarium oxysporum f. sp. conglutinans]